MGVAKAPIRTWRQFARRVRRRSDRLLLNLPHFPDAVLVSGCQRSGTTIVTRILGASDDLMQYVRGRDDELDAALLLAGAVPLPNERGLRYCFQTTYLNERYGEYFDHVGKYRLVWVIRNPFSVVYSLLYNWRRFAFNELFNACGRPLLDEREHERFRRFGRFALNRCRRASLAYNGKLNQAVTLRERLGPSRMMVIDYDDLVSDAGATLNAVFEFLGLTYEPAYATQLSQASVNKARLLSRPEREIVSETCYAGYREVRSELCGPWGIGRL
jgi:hypothetical protein